MSFSVKSNEDPLFTLLRKQLVDWLIWETHRPDWTIETITNLYDFKFVCRCDWQSISTEWFNLFEDEEISKSKVRYEAIRIKRIFERAKNV